MNPREIFASYGDGMRPRHFDRETYGATCDGEPVGTAWIVFPEDSAFAELYGGSILAGFRGRGIYTALLDLRTQSARRRGYRYLAVDAMPMSRPILLRKGFALVCETWPMKWSPAGDRSNGVEILHARVRYDDTTPVP